MSIAYKWLMPVALVGAISVAAVTVISASSGSGRVLHEGWEFVQGDDESEDGECDRGKGHGRLSGGFTELAELVGTDLDGLKSAISEGQTLAEIAEANDVEVQSVVDALVERANERIDAAVESGRLTEEEAETKRDEAATKIDDLVNNGLDRENLRGWGKGKGRGYGHGHGRWHKEVDAN